MKRCLSALALQLLAAGGQHFQLSAVGGHFGFQLFAVGEFLLVVHKQVPDGLGKFRRSWQGSGQRFDRLHLGGLLFAVEKRFHVRSAKNGHFVAKL